MTETPEQLAERTEKAMLDDIVNSYLDACAAIEKWETIKKQNAEQIAGILGPGRRHEVVPGVGVSVSRPSYRFDPVRARAVLTTEQYNSICEMVPSATQAAAMLPGALVDQCKVTNGKPTVKRLA